MLLKTAENKKHCVSNHTSLVHRLAYLLKRFTAKTVGTRNSMFVIYIQGGLGGGLGRATTEAKARRKRRLWISRQPPHAFYDAKGLLKKKCSTNT